MPVNCGMTYIISVEITRLGQIVQLGPKLARMILPDLAILFGNPILRRGQPIRLVSACLGYEIDFKASFLEDFKWM